MIEKALKGSPTYWLWILLLLTLMGFGYSSYATQLSQGLAVTGVGGSTIWGLKVMQFAVMATIAASFVVVVALAYLKESKPANSILITSQFIAVSSAATALVSLVADCGKPQLLFELVRSASLSSPYFLAILSLKLYLLTSLVSSWATLGAEAKGVPAASWVKSVALLSLPFGLLSPIFVALTIAVGVAIVQLFAASIAGGFSLLLLVLALLKQRAGYSVDSNAPKSIATMALYAGVAHLVLTAVAWYASSVENGTLFAVASVTAILGVVLFALSLKKGNFMLPAVAMVLSVIFAIAGTGSFLNYAPSGTELSIVVGVFSCGLLVATLLLKTAAAIRREA